MKNPKETEIANNDQISSTYNIEIEQHLLGYIITNSNAINDIADVLSSEYFYHPLHQKIYQQINEFSEKNFLISPLTLKNYFASDNKFDPKETTEYINNLVKNTSFIFDLKEYADILYNLALKRQLIDVGTEIVNNAKTSNNSITANEQIEMAEANLYNLASAGSKANDFDAISSSLNLALETAELAMNAGGHTGISTDFTDLDKTIGGLQNSDLIILAGRPSMGKTALAINIALNACRNLAKSDEKKSVGFFSLEMSSEQLSGRMIAMESTVNAKKFRNGSLNSEDFEKIVDAHKQLYDLPFFIDDTPAQTIGAIRTKARRLKRQHNLSLLVIDYLQLLSGSKKSNDNRVQEISEITQGLKAIAKELNIPVIALSQLSRAVEQREDKRPLLSDLRESGTIEQDADLVFFIYREQYYVERRKPSEGHKDMDQWQEYMEKVLNQAEVVIAKNRHGPVGNIKLYFDPNTTKFSNLQNY